MATGKKTAEYIVPQGLRSTLEEGAVAAGREPDAEWSVSDVMEEETLAYGDAMFFVCREEILPGEVLRNFATQIAQSELPLVTRALGAAAAPFKAAVQALVEGADLEEHAKAVQRCLVTNLAIEGPGDMGDPQKIAAYKRLRAACKAIRAATRPSPGEAAYASANWVYRAVPQAKREDLGWEHRCMLAQIFSDFNLHFSFN